MMAINNESILPSTKGRCIQIKSGMSADFSDDVLKVAEFGLILDTNELRIGLADGSTMKVNGGGININDIPDASLSQKGLMTQAHVVKLDGISSGANFVQVEDTLTSTSSTSALSAKQGKTLKDAIDAIGSGGSGGNLPPATAITLGGIKVGNNLSVISDGTLSVPIATTSTVGVSMLNDTVTSTSNTEAATASAVKQAYDKALEAMNSGGNVANIYQKNVTTSITGTAFGDNTQALGAWSIAIGESSIAKGTVAYAAGNHSDASGDDSQAIGEYTIANARNSHVIGRYNKMLDGDPLFFDSTGDGFVLGNGGDNISRSNAFRVTFDGKVYGLSAFNSSGADYAEYFEWLDSNPNNEDRVGYFVTLNGDKIEIANSTSDYIIGVISANPSVIGDSHQDQWQGMYVRDEWGRIQNEYVDVKYEDFDNDGNTITKTRQDYVHKLNPDFNNEEEYIGREARQEWDAVGMLGKLLVRDDGSCEVNGYAKVADGGIATKSDTGYRVIKRINENIVQIIFK